MKITDEQKSFVLPTLDTSDEDLIRLSIEWLEESKKYSNELDKFRKENEAYYKGNQTELSKIPSNMSNAVQNHVFTGVETVVPIITANPPQFVVEPPEESDTSVKYAEAIQKVLSILYETKDIRTKGEMLVRHMLLYRLGVWKISWDEKEDDVGLKCIRPQRIYFPKIVDGELPYIIEQVDISSKEFRDVFGDDKFKEFLTNRGQDFNPEELNKIKGIWTIWEIWTKDIVFWKHGEMIIEKRENPGYNFKSEGQNHFKNPKIPYIFASAFRLGKGLIGETDLIQQTISIQDVINVTNRLIINNATKTGNAQWFIDSEVMSEEEANTKITNSPGLIIYGTGVANSALVRRDAPPPLPNYIPELKIMAERAFDNIFGTHSTTRGERGQQETLGGRLLLKQADLGRIDLLVREYEKCVSELGNWFVQYMKLNYSKKRVFRSYGESGVSFVELMSDMIESGVKIIIKTGTTLPTDELSKRREALELWSMGAIDPTTLYERLKFSNPEEMAEKLLLWKQGQIDMETGAEQGTVPGRQVKPLPSPQREVGKQEGKITK